MRVHLDGAHGERIDYAVERLAAAAHGIELVDDGAELVAGTVAGATIGELVRSGAVELHDGPESLAIARVDDTLVVAGSDEQGLMYALLEVADQLAVAGRSLGDIAAVSQHPETELRGSYTTLHNADCERDWFFARDHWEAYFDLLADSRFNSFMLVIGHQTPYLVPPFPFFVDVPEHPEVVVPGLGDEERRRNLDALRMIAEQAGRRGLAFVLGIWEVIAWVPGTRGGHTQQSMVEGLDAENLAGYTYHGTKRLLAEVPGIAGVQLRVNAESGIPHEHQTAFFSETVFPAIAECDRDLFLDVRGWFAHPETIQAAADLGIPMRLSMKYWAEHLGAPYQAALQEPAYSYADFLRFPRRFPVAYQVWTLGSHRHFIWGDPDYVRTFAGSLRLGEAVGFEICPPLAQKGYGNEPGAWRVLAPEHEYYRWEWERYWMFHLLFGRLTYDSRSDDGPWMRRLTARFGEAAGDVLAAYRAASQVVSLIIRFNMSDPNMYIWPEADTGGVLDFYLAAPPSDPARMKSFADATAERLSGQRTARMEPTEVADRLEAIGADCLAAAAALRRGGPAGDDHPGRELMSTAVDTEALGELALYHAEKIRAADALGTYYATGHLGALGAARRGLERARPHWERLAAVTDGVYTDHQVTGPVDSGHWKDKLALVDEDEARLAERFELHDRYGGGAIGGAAAAFDFGAVPQAAYSYTRYPVHHDMVERGFIGVDDTVRWRYGGTYGWEVIDGGLSAIASPLARFCDRHLDRVFRDTMADPGYDRLVPFTDTLYRDYVAGDGRSVFHASVPAGVYEVVVVCCDRSERASSHGPFSVTVNGRTVAEGLVVGPDELVELRGVHELGRGELVVGFAAAEGAGWFCSAIVARPVAPVPSHVPPRVAAAGDDITLELSVTSVAPVEGASLLVDGREIEMTAADDERLFRAAIPGDLAVAGAELRYRFVVRTAAHTVSAPPAAERPDDAWYPLRVVQPGRTRPVIRHQPVTGAAPGVEIPITAAVDASGPLSRAVLHYRSVNQYYPWNRVAMSEAAGELAAVIPAEYVVADWDLMYFIEVVDDAGMGAIAPGGADLSAIPYWVVPVGR